VSTSSAAAAPAPAGTELTHRQILSIMSGLMLGMFLAALDQTIVASAMRTIPRAASLRSTPSFAATVSRARSTAAMSAVIVPPQK